MLQDGAAYTGPLDARTLATLASTGHLPLTVALALTPPEAAGAALSLPPASYDRERPIGFGLYPPQGAEPLMVLKEAYTASDGRRVKRNARGILGVMWRGRSESSPVHRLFFKSRDGSARWVDVYDDQIASIVTLDSVIPALTGWQIAAL
jgi:hypothetical protein